MKKDNCIVVGGGICGIFSAILLADKFTHVYLIEKDDECGGLLKSVQDANGNIYDQGTHVPNNTFIPEIDEILFGNKSLQDENWSNLGKPRTGNFFCGQWNLIHQMLDVRNLPEHIYQKGIVELLSITKESKAKDLVTFLIETLGPTFTQEAVAPIAKKLYGKDVDLTQLTKDSSVGYFGLSRVLALVPEVAKKLKELPLFDTKLTYHNEKDFEERIEKDGETNSQFQYYYPKNNKGVGFWVEFMISQAKAKGVKFLTGEYVSAINYQDDVIHTIDLGKSGEQLPCDYLWWTAPPILALKAANIKVEPRKVSFRSACIFHFTVDKPLLNNSAYYLWNWDENYKAFRITLYPNMQKNTLTKGYKVTAEVLCSHSETENVSLSDIFEELKEIEIIAQDAKILGELKQVIHNTFPVTTFEMSEAIEDHYNTLTSAFNNIHLAGRFSGKNWFHHDVLKSAYKDIKQLF